MKVGIDLLWLKVGKVGGTESYARNLLDGFYEFADENSCSFVLFLAQDNVDTFDKYFAKSTFRKVVLPIKSENVVARIFAENFVLDRYAKNEGIDLMFVPVYSKPLMKNRRIPYVITIHDLQALHYPEYFSKLKNLWLRFAWRRCATTAEKIVAISNFVKDDIIKMLHIDPNKIEVIYNPVSGLDKFVDFDELRKKYKIQERGYYYTVCSMLPHKNLKTLLYVIKKIKDQPLDIPKKLVISGIGGKSETEIKNLIDELGIADEVVITGFISNEERNTLYKNAKIFLFPSIFEGFGMPPVEAMMLGTPVITTKKASLYEVTKGKAFYVDDPYNIDEWFMCISELNSWTRPFNIVAFEEYDIRTIYKEYIKLFEVTVRNDI